MDAANGADAGRPVVAQPASGGRRGAGRVVLGVPCAAGAQAAADVRGDGHSDSRRLGGARAGAARLVGDLRAGDGNRLVRRLRAAPGPARPGRGWIRRARDAAPGRLRGVATPGGMDRPRPAPPARRTCYPPRAMTSTSVRFPEGFLWGAATSAHQVEGGNQKNDWWRFEQSPGTIADGTTSGEACRHYQMFDADFALAAGDGHRAHRLSIEWSRIEPEHGHIDSRAVDHYHEVFASLKRHRLIPVVTLHHFTSPLWIADHGGWESADTLERFLS